MLFSFIGASIVLAGLSVARPQHSLANQQPIQTVSPNTAYTSSIAPTGTVASCDGQISSPAQLSKRDDPDDPPLDWDDVAGTGIAEGGDALKYIMSLIFGDKETKSITETVTHTPGPTTSPGESGMTTVTKDPVTTTITKYPETTTDPKITGTVTIPTTGFHSTFTSTVITTVFPSTLTSTSTSTSISTSSSTQESAEPKCTTCGCPQDPEWAGVPW